VKVRKVAPIRRPELMPERVRVYVDGSSDNRVTKTGGWAAVLLIPGETYRIISGALESPTNNQIAELKAAIEGLRWAWYEALDRLDGGLFSTGDPQVEVISDSKYVVKGITEYEASWRLNGWITSTGEPVKHIDLWKQLKSMDNDCTVWTHIRGHQGNVFNEMADKEASVVRKRMLQQGEQ